MSQQLKDTNQLEKAKNIFIAITSHKLLTPITAIRWNIEMLRKEISKDDEKLNRIVNDISTQNDNLADFSKYMLDINNIMMGDSVQSESAAVNFKQILEEVISSTKYDASKVTFNNSIADKDFIVKGNLSRWKTIFLSIIDNSVRSADDNEGVKIDCTSTHEESSGALNISIIDNGRGIPKDELDMVLSPFYRSSSTIKTEVSGFGLELYIAKLYIENVVLGKLGIDSGGEGQGTKVNISIPTSTGTDSL